MYNRYLCSCETCRVTSATWCFLSRPLSVYVKAAIKCFLACAVSISWYQRQGSNGLKLNRLMLFTHRDVQVKTQNQTCNSLSHGFRLDWFNSLTILTSEYFANSLEIIVLSSKVFTVNTIRFC